MEKVGFISQSENEKEFARVLQRRVRDYFKENDITSKGDYRMIIKAIFMVGIYLAPLVVILTIPLPGWFALLLCVIIGLGLAGIGMAVMHDAVHGAFSNKPWVNKLMGKTMFLLGSNVINWKIQHNILHHTYTNIYHWDGDIDTKGIIRLSEHAPLKRVQRYQHIYAFLLYGLMTLSKIVTDFGQLKGYHKRGYVKMLGLNYHAHLWVLVAAKTLYVGVFIALPILFTDFSWWQIILGFLVIHTTASAIMSTVFQMAHVVRGPAQPLPDNRGMIPTENFVHQLRTTSDFGSTGRVMSWYIGGLDYQVEHHLFPNVCHLYYPKIAPIVEATAKEFGFAYYKNKSFFTALASHIHTLKVLGRQKTLAGV